MTTYTGTHYDADDELGLGFVEINYELHCTIDPGDPGCWRDANGDGWPAIPPSVDCDKIEIVSVIPQDGAALKEPLTVDWIERVRTLVDRVTQEQWESIEQEIFDAQPCEADDA